MTLTRSDRIYYASVEIETTLNRVRDKIIDVVEAFDAIKSFETAGREVEVLSVAIDALREEV
jgi:hypothetical protein